MGYFTDLDMDVLYNRNRPRVIQALEDYLLAHQEACHCRECRLDMAALILNAIPPRYVVSEEHMKFFGHDRPVPTEDDLRAAIDRAARVVKERPHHN